MTIRSTLGDIVNRHSNLVAAVLTLLTAILSFALAFVGQSRNEAIGTNADLELEVAQLQRENGALRSQLNQDSGTIESLEDTTREQTERIADLEGQLAGTTDGGPAGPDSPAPASELYPEKILEVELDGCDRTDDVDLDVAAHPVLGSDSELDFDYCMQSRKYAVATNGAVLSGAAAPTSGRDDCIAAVEQEPASPSQGFPIESGTVLCLSDFDEEKGQRIFRVRVAQVAGRTITLAVTGWR